MTTDKAARTRGCDLLGKTHVAAALAPPDRVRRVQRLTKADIAAAISEHGHH